MTGANQNTAIQSQTLSKAPSNRYAAVTVVGLNSARNRTCEGRKARQITSKHRQSVGANPLRTRFHPLSTWPLVSLRWIQFP
jgi:hypothetical protein